MMTFVFAMALALTAQTETGIDSGQLFLRRIDIRKYPTPRYGAAAVTDGKLLYLVGGSGKYKVFLGQIDIYDPATKGWETLSRELIPRRWARAVLVDEFIYILGGYNRAGYGRTASLVSEVERVNIKTGEVTRLAPLMRPRYFADAAYYQGEIFVTGGTTKSSHVGWTDIYNIEGDTWESGPDLREARNARLVTVGDNLYAMGGFAGSNEPMVKTVDRFDQTSKNWVKSGSIPEAISGFTPVVVGDNVLTFGDYKTLNKIWQWNVSKNKWWLHDTDFMVPHRHATSVLIGNHIYVVGGNTDSANASSIETMEVFAVQSEGSNNRSCPRLLIESKDEKHPEREAKALRGLDTCGHGWGFLASAAAVAHANNDADHAASYCVQEMGNPGPTKEAFRTLFDIWPSISPDKKAEIVNLGSSAKEPLYVPNIGFEYKWFKYVVCDGSIKLLNQALIRSDGRKLDRLKISCDGKSYTRYFDLNSPSAGTAQSAAIHWRDSRL